VIHVKPFACMPEISAMPMLYRISQDYQFPILYFSFDTLTSETGIKTRLEAFYDMIIMKEQWHDTQSLPRG
jgi:predicted nucleotide-binding protein (sugar kinase/HSP70/actin superfamily)